MSANIKQYAMRIYSTRLRDKQVALLLTSSAALHYDEILRPHIRTASYLELN